MNINWTEIALAIIAILAGIVTHQLDKRKHKVEIDQLKAEIKQTNSHTEGTNIDNMDKSLDFYEKLAESTNKRLDKVLATQDFTSLGFPALISLFQYCSKRLYHAFANLPPRPSLFVSLISFKNFFVKKYVVNSVQLLKHAMELFIKHVLPKLRPPHTP